MKLISEIEIAYFRSFYKVKFRDIDDFNMFFGKNDAGKSNVIRALNLFFNNEPDNISEFDFDIDFSEKRLRESEISDDVRKFIYVKIVFDTPKNYQRSLGKTFYVKRQWTISRDQEYHEEVSGSISSSRRHIVTRFLNKIRFIYIPAIKDNSIFESLLDDIYTTLSTRDDFFGAIQDFTVRVQDSTSNLFSSLPIEVARETKISTPKRMDVLFQTLDFETVSSDTEGAKSLTLQRGDGIKARHIPELLKFISDNDGFDYHIWGFEEPENSLDFVAAEAEAKRFFDISSKNKVQIFITTHSPAFYNLKSDGSRGYYIVKQDDGTNVVQGKDLEKYDVDSALGDGFYLPAIAKKLEEFSEKEKIISDYKEKVDEVNLMLAQMTSPLVLTEGDTDAIILREAWGRLRTGVCSYRIESCDTNNDPNNSAAGALKLATCLKGIRSDSPNLVIGLFDFDKEGLDAFKLDKNFVQEDLLILIKSATHGRAFGAMLPVPQERIDCKEFHNFPIEYLFSDEHLSHSVDGRRLRLDPLKVIHRVGEKNIEVPVGSGTSSKKPCSRDKKYFAEKIVPDLPDDAFVNFGPVFEMIESICEM